ncbi:hypothetical protein AX774_g5503, partial [Zancudomyces culisetae]
SESLLHFRLTIGAALSNCFASCPSDVHTRALPSKLPVANRSPSVLQPSVVISVLAGVCARTTAACCGSSIDHIRAVPSPAPVASLFGYLGFHADTNADWLCPFRLSLSIAVCRPSPTPSLLLPPKLSTTTSSIITSLLSFSATSTIASTFSPIKFSSPALLTLPFIACIFCSVFIYNNPL